MSSIFTETLPQLFAKTGTFSKPTKIYGNYSKNTRSKSLRETKSVIIGGTRIENGKVKKFNIPSRAEKCASCLSRQELYVATK